MYLCKSKLPSAHAVEIYNQEQQSFLAQKAGEIEKSTGISRNWWIGLQKFGQSWIWQYSLSPANYTNWSKDEPFSTEHFACLYKDYGYSWRSATISLYNVWPICQVVSSHVYLLTTFFSIIPLFHLSESTTSS